MSARAQPSDGDEAYRGTGGRNTVFGNWRGELGPMDETLFEPATVPSPDFDGLGEMRDQSITLKHIKLDAVVQPLDRCLENNLPSNFPGTLHWCLFVHKPPAIPPYPTIFEANVAMPGSGIARAFTWSYAFNEESGIGTYFDPETDLIDFGVMAICPQRQWSAQNIHFDPPVYEVNTVEVDGTTEGTLTPIPPVNNLEFLGWYAGGSDTSGKISVDKKLDNLVVPKNSLIVLEYRLECERRFQPWFNENVTFSDIETQLAVKVNGACLVHLAVNER